MRSNPIGTGLIAWLVPGAGHFLAGESRKAMIFFAVLGAMFVLGLGFRGELFAFDFAEPLVSLASAAQWALGLPRLLATIMGGGRGDVTAVTYEYGNTFLIVAGLLNMLVVLDAVDLARGVKRR